jgi:hypothetical protein
LTKKKGFTIEEVNGKTDIRKCTKKMANGTEKVFYLRCMHHEKDYKNPSEKYNHEYYQDIYTKDLTLFASYAWDSNSYPGNEYYVDQLAASGDPAAICSCDAAYYHNAYANPNIRGEYAAIYNTKSPAQTAGGYFNEDNKIIYNRLIKKTLKNTKYTSIQNKKLTKFSNHKKRITNKNKP